MKITCNFHFVSDDPQLALLDSRKVVWSRLKLMTFLRTHAKDVVLDKENDREARTALDRPDLHDRPQIWLSKHANLDELNVLGTS